MKILDNIQGNGIVLQCTHCKKSAFYEESEVVLDVVHSVEETKIRFAGVIHHCPACKRETEIARAHNPSFARWSSYTEIFVGSGNPKNPMFTPENCRRADEYLTTLVKNTGHEKSFPNCCFTFPCPTYGDVVGFGVTVFGCRDGDHPEEIDFPNLSKQVTVMTNIVKRVFEFIGIEDEVKVYCLSSYD